jgi:hypothetical protein
MKALERDQLALAMRMFDVYIAIKVPRTEKLIAVEV